MVEFLSPGPDSKDELIETLADAEDRELIDPDSRAMLEGVLRMADLSAGDVMVAAPACACSTWPEALKNGWTPSSTPATPASPVFDQERDNIVGIFLAKDLLKTAALARPLLRTPAAPTVFVPETKRLNELLRDFRANRHHMAIVIDEFGKGGRLITIEDVLEEIVGEIEDEFDPWAPRPAPSPWPTAASAWKSHADIAQVNGVLGTQFPVDEFDTIGGLIAHELGHVPRRGESITLQGWEFSTMLTRGGVRPLVQGHAGLRHGR